MTKSGFLCDNQLSEWTEKRLQRTSQCQTCTKNKKGHGHRWSAASLIHYSSLNPGETITSEKYAQQIDEMHRKLQWSTSISQQNEPNSSLRQCLTACHKTNASKVERTESQSFASSLIFTWSLVKGLPLLQASWQLFAEKMLSQQMEEENAFQGFIESQITNFYATEINKLISHLQKYVDYNGSYFD